MQKLIHLGLLELTGFDFRSLIILNMALSAAMSLLFMHAVRKIRGSSEIGDLAIPFICLNFGAGLTFYAFEGQFMFTSLSIALFTLFVARSENGSSQREMILASASLVLMAWTGMNGVICALVLSFGMLAYILWQRQRTTVWALGLLIAAFAMSSWQIAVWNPSSDQIGRAAESVMFEYVAGIYSSIFPVFGGVGYVVSAIVLTAVLLAGIALSFKPLLACQFKDMQSVGLIGVVLVVLSMIGVIAYGRAQLQPFSMGVGMHYSILIAPLFFAGWALLSRQLSGKASTFAGMIVLVWAVSAFYQSVQWRSISVNDSKEQFKTAAKAIKSTKPTDEVVNENIRAMYAVDTPDSRRIVKNGLDTLRRIGGKKYHPE
ncbi:hypothetical protein [Pseudomonas panipatensis]|uniref:hypothetical protein n=1 Tax=Pseudomonas panipatensis TaxID=428992 RepID=UPI001113B6CC|nr:hypothetical protein [Pseudomonas panipatensis]